MHYYLLNYILLKIYVVLEYFLMNSINIMLYILCVSVSKINSTCKTILKIFSGNSPEVYYQNENYVIFKKAHFITIKKKQSI